MNGQFKTLQTRFMCYFNSPDHTVSGHSFALFYEHLVKFAFMKTLNLRSAIVVGQFKILLTRFTCYFNSSDH